MSVAQTRAARRRNNLIRRVNGPKPIGKQVGERRLAEKKAREKQYEARGK